MTARVAAIAVLLAVVTVAACSTTGGRATGTGTLTVTEAWARPSTGMALAGAAYLSITNGTGQADALLGVTTPAAKNPELHETTADASGMMAMHPVSRIEIPAGGTVKLEPGGYHIMLINLTGEFVAGSTIELTLQFEKAAPVTVTAEVRAS
jgi:copper(I)-binding protein